MAQSCCAGCRHAAGGGSLAGGVDAFFWNSRALFARPRPAWDVVIVEQEPTGQGSALLGLGEGELSCACGSVRREDGAEHIWGCHRWLSIALCPCHHSPPIPQLWFGGGLCTAGPWPGELEVSSGSHGAPLLCSLLALLSTDIHDPHHIPFPTSVLGCARPSARILEHWVHAAASFVLEPWRSDVWFFCKC